MKAKTWNTGGAGNKCGKFWDSGAMNNWSSHSRHKLKLEGEIRINRHVFAETWDFRGTHFQVERGSWAPLWHGTVVQRPFLQIQRDFYKPTLTQSSFHLIFSPSWPRGRSVQVPSMLEVYRQ